MAPVGEQATALDVEAKTVTVGNPVAYEQLVIATGTRARTWPGEMPANAYVVRDLGDALELKAALSTARSVAIVGAGFIGCEVASSARKLGLDVTLIDVAEQPMTALGPSSASAARSCIASMAWSCGSATASRTSTLWTPT